MSTLVLLSADSGSSQVTIKNYMEIIELIEWFTNFILI